MLLSLQQALELVATPVSPTTEAIKDSGKTILRIGDSLTLSSAPIPTSLPNSPTCSGDSMAQGSKCTAKPNHIRDLTFYSTMREKIKSKYS